MDFKGLSERIRAEREAADRDAEEIAGRLEALAQKRPTVVARAHAYLDQKHAEVAMLENDLNQLSNMLPEDEKAKEDAAERPTPQPPPR